MFYLNNGSSDSTHIIQGVGSRAGLFESFHSFFESDANLLCYAQNEITYYPAFEQPCDYDVSLDEIQLEERMLIGIFDSLGRETDDKPNTLLIYMYSDGTSEKVFRVD